MFYNIKNPIVLVDGIFYICNTKIQALFPIKKTNVAILFKHTSNVLFYKIGLIKLL